MDPATNNQNTNPSSPPTPAPTAVTPPPITSSPPLSVPLSQVSPVDDQPAPPPTPGILEPAITTPSTPPLQPMKGGRFKKSWLLFESALRALKSDKSLVGIQFSGVLISILLAIVAAVIGFAYVITASNIPFLNTVEDGETVLAWYALLPLVLLVTIAFTTAGTFIAVAISYGALRVFDGQNVTVSECLSAALKRFGSILSFGVLSGTIGFILRLIEERLGSLSVRIVTRLFGAVWAVATMFVPVVIANSANKVSGLEATKQSVNVIKKTWGESLILTVTVGLATGLIMFLYIFVSFVAAAGLAILANSSVVTFGAPLLAIVGLFILILVLSTLSAIVNVALYYYATFGHAPQGFAPELLQAVLEPRKKRRGLFGK